MSLERAESINSSGTASNFHDVALTSGILDQDPEQDDLLQTSSLEAGVFGVLFTLHEKDQQHIRIHWSIIKYVVAAWQIYVTILNPEFGWDIDPGSIYWRWVSVLTLRWFKDVGYHWYEAALYTFAVVLAINLSLCVWVAWSFKEQKFDYVWPIKVVRYFSYIFLMFFDMTSLNFLQLGISCNFSARGKARFHLDVFPYYSCQRPPQIINAVVSGLLLLVFVVIALLFNMAEVEVDPSSKMTKSLGHSGAAMTAFGIKALMTLVGVFLGWPKVAAVAYCVLATWLAWEYLRWVPNLLIWVNCVKTGVATAMLSTAALQVVLVFLPRSTSRHLTIAMALLLGPAFLAGALVTWLRIQLFDAAVKRAFRSADPEAVKPQDIYHFAHPRDVEIAARCARVWTDLYTLEKTAVHRAEEIIKAGVALFPDNAYVALVYANFMLDMLGFSQTGAKQLEGVRKFNPSLMCRFMLFVRHQQATQKAASSNVGKGGSMDLLGYVEYQRKQRTLLRHHKDALQAMANFWRILGCSSVSFTSLSRSLEKIDESVSKAESAYRVAMELYNNSPRLVQLYARFLETIKQDPWTASQYYQTAERLEKTKDYNSQGPSLPDGTPMSLIDEVEKGILVVNAFGDIQVANGKLYDMFGYKKGELDGKNVTALMPPHEAKRHPAILRRYIDSGDKAPPYFRHPVLGIHRERVALTVRISVSRASGLGEDSVFIGFLELLPNEPGTGRVWVTPEGVIVCCDPGFVTCFGYHPDDVIGMHLDKLLRSSARGGYDGLDRSDSDIWITNQANHKKDELVQRMLSNAADRVDGDEIFGANVTKCHVLHKYDFAKPCNIDVRRDLTGSSILEVRMKLLSDEPQLLMVVERKGNIRHMSGDLAKVLGVRADCDSDDEFGGNMVNNDHQVMLELIVEAPPCCLDDFLTPPWKAMHYKYRKYVKSRSPNLSGLWGCRAAVDDCNGFTGPTMKLVGMHGKPVYVHVDVSSREEDGEPVHIVRMARSSLETAVAERRIRMEVSLEGVVQELQHHGGKAVTHANPHGLFGFPPEELIGCRLADFLSLEAVYSHSPTRPLHKPDLLAKAEELVTGTGCGGINEPAGVEGPVAFTPGMQMWEPLDFATYDAMVTSALQVPGISWRVKIVSPRTAAEATLLGDPVRTAAVLAQQTMQAVLKLDVEVPKPNALGSVPDKLKVYAEMWLAEAVTGVLEIDGTGKVSGILEEDVRPPGLLFGLPKEEILGSPLGTLLRLLPGQSPVGLLTDSGIAKKSALKASSKKGKIAVKVGPVHYLEGFHRDHQPLNLAVQVVGKPGPGNPVTAIVRFASSKHPNALGTDAATKAGGPPGARGVGAPAAHHKASHVCLDLGGRALTSRGGGASVSSRAGTAILRLREPSVAATAATASAPTQLSALMPSPPPMAVGQNDSQDLTRTNPGAEAPQPAPPLAFTLTPVIMPRVTGPGGGVVGETAATAPTTAAVLPGATALAAGVAGIMKNRHVSTATAAVAAAAGPTELGGVDYTGISSPEKPASPSLAGPSKVYIKRPSAAVSRKVLGPGIPGTAVTAAAAGAATGTGNSGDPTSTLPGVPIINSEGKSPGPGSEAPVSLPPPALAEGVKGGKAEVGAPQDRNIETISLAGADDGSEEGADQMGLGGVNKWVVTDGKFYRNKLESKDGMYRMQADLDEDEDDGAGSLGGLSRATSSHFASPRGSLYGGVLDGEEDNPLMQPHMNMYPQHQQQHPKQQPFGGPHPHHNHQHQHQQNPYHAYGQPFESHQHYGQQVGSQQHPYHPHQHHHHYYQHQHNQQHPYPYQHARYGFGGDDGILDVAGGAGGGADYVGGGDWESSVTGNHRLHRVRRSSYLQSGSIVMPAESAWAIDATSVDQGDECDSEGDSDISGITGVSGDSGNEDPADYKRGKRYRKLIKLMKSPNAKKAMVRLKIHTMLAVLGALCIHVLSFSLIITSVNKQSRALDQLAEAGGGQRYLQRSLVSVRALDQIYKDTDVATVYARNDSEVFANDLLLYAEMYRDVTNGLLQRNGGIVEQLFYTLKLQVWAGYDFTTSANITEYMSVWDVISRVYVYAKIVFQDYKSWHTQGLDMTFQTPVNFLLLSGQALTDDDFGVRPIANALLESAVKWTNTVNNLQLTFLLVEGLCVAGFCAAGMMYMLKLAFDQRYHLYETFLSIPIGLTRALAAQTTHLLDDESDSQSEEEDDKEHYEDGPPSITATGGTTTAASAAKRKTFFDDSPTVLQMDSKDEGSATGADDGIGAGGGIDTGGAGGDFSSRLDKVDYDDSGTEAVITRRYGHPPLAKMKGTSKRFMLPPQDSFGPMGDISLLTPTTLDPTNSACLPQFFQRWWSRMVQSKFPPPGQEPGVIQTRRILIRNSKVAKGMLSVVLLYSLLVILFYSVNYVILLNVTDQVGLQAVADLNAERTYRAVFYAQELVAEKDPRAVSRRVDELRNATIALRDAYLTMRMGAKASTVVGGTVETFPSVIGSGLIKGSAAMFNLFYADNTCLRLPEHMPCPSRDYRFYEVTRSGADGMMNQLLNELSNLADESMAAAATALITSGNDTRLPGRNCTRWDFIYNVGTIDLNDANLRIRSQHISDVKDVLRVVVVLHVVLLLLLLGLFVSFLMLGYLPLMKRMEKEKRRIAELMSQLPPELDVMRLFSTAILGNSNVSGGGHLHNSGRSQSGGGITNNRAVSVSGGGGDVIIATAAAVRSVSSPGAKAGAGSAQALLTAGTNANDGPSGKFGDDGGSNSNIGSKAWKDILARASINGANGAIHPSSVASRALKGKALAS
ncbi:hypothetical protein Vafri_484 [Volvox africanus]|nr:hypothetical protein Vafri_484 [Volvox africanus]